MGYNYYNKLLKNVFTSFLLILSFILLSYGNTDYSENSVNIYDPLNNAENENLGEGVYINSISQEHLDDMRAMIEVYDEAYKNGDVPDQLFDITFVIDTYKISNIQELTGLVTYTSFGQVPTPVNYTFTLRDKNSGKILRKYSGYIVVQTELVEIIYFEELHDLQLPYGDYIITYKSVYNVDVVDEFIQEFSIGNSESKGVNFTLILGGLVGILIIGGPFFFFRK
jgi:hypothetical protein